MDDGQKRGFMQFQDVRAFLDNVLDEDIHTKRVGSLANATLGVMTGASLGVAIIGKSLAQARGLLPKHAIKQVDRLLSNSKLEAWDVFAPWVPEMVGPREDIVVAMDWTDYDADGQATLALKLVTRHGRATPLVWLSVLKDELSHARNDYEDACLRRLAEVLPAGVRVTILADRGFADTKLFGFLDELGFAYVIRLKGNTTVRAADGPTRPAGEWVGQGGRARKLRDAAVTEARCPVGAVVCVHAKGMKEAWCLAASNAAAPSRQIIDLYSKRWGVEIVFTQLTKAPLLAVWADGDDVADLDFVVGDHDAVDQKFHQLAPLGEVGLGQSRLDPSAEVRGRSRPAGELRGAIDLGFQLVRLDT